MKLENKSSTEPVPVSDDPNGEVDELTPIETDDYYGTKPVKLTTEQVQQIWRQIDLGREFQKKKLHKIYEKANTIWDGQHYPTENFTSVWQAQLVINVIPNTIKSLVESVAYSDPDFTIIPKNEYGEKTQGIIKNALQYWWSQSKVSFHRKKAVYDSKLYGVGFLQVGWLYENEDVRLENDRLETLPDGITIDDAKDAEEKGYLKPGETADDFSEDDPIEDRFLVRRINPMDMYVPQNATTDVDEWDWCARRSYVPLSEVKRDPRYRTGRKNKEGNYSSSTVISVKDLRGDTKLAYPYDSYNTYIADGVHDKENGESPPDVRYVEIIEYYERKRRIHVILCEEEREKYLFAEKWTWKSNRYPFRTIHNTTRPDDFYGKSVPVELWHLQFELNVARSGATEHAQQFNRMYQAPKNCLDTDAITALGNGRPGTVIQYEEGHGESPIKQIPHLQLQPEMYQIYQWALQGIEQISGLSQYQMHNPPSKRLTNDEANAISQAGGILFLSDAQSVVHLDKQLAEDCLALCEQFDTTIENLAANDGNTSNKVWRKFTGKEIRGNTLVDIWPQSTQPPDAESELQKNEMTTKLVVEYGQLVVQMAQAPATVQLIPGINKLFRAQLRLLGVRNADEYIPLPPPPAPPQMAPQQPGLPPQGQMPPGQPTPPPQGIPGPPGPQGPQGVDPQQMQQVLAMMQNRQ